MWSYNMLRISESFLNLNQERQDLKRQRMSFLALFFFPCESQPTLVFTKINKDVALIFSGGEICKNSQN